MKPTHRRIIITASLLVLVACRSARLSVTPGMTATDVIRRSGEPRMKWVGTNGVECWQCTAPRSFTRKSGRWYVVLKDDVVLRVVPRHKNFSNLEIGLPEAAATALMGTPTSVSATSDTKYLNYAFGSGMHYVRIVDGVVESYGRLGDFDSTKVSEKTINVNIDDKRE